MSLLNNEFFSSQGFLSQGTINEIQRVIEGVTPPELPVKRIIKENINNKCLKLSLPENDHLLKGSKERPKVVEYKKSKLIYLARESIFRVSVKYNKCSADNFIRIYPNATDPIFVHSPIICCPTHSKNLTNVHPDMLEYAMGSIMEVLDCHAKYELIELAENAVQVSILVKFWAPDLNIDLMNKCYNTCHKQFRKSFPKLHFTVEKLLEPKKYLVLSEQSIYFKVCASPARDCKSMTLKQCSMFSNPASSVRSNLSVNSDTIDVWTRGNLEVTGEDDIDNKSSIKDSGEASTILIEPYQTRDEIPMELQKNNLETVYKMKSILHNGKKLFLSSVKFSFLSEDGKKRKFKIRDFGDD